ncbi:MAG: hypothetical protein J6X55_05290 [Victivallales bacterium]|nr:hypothetical protein [Victivallales bacterium]
MKIKLIILYIVFKSFIVCSCLNNDRLLGYNEHLEGLKIEGEMSRDNFFFIPTCSLEQYHIYNSLSIDYKRIRSGMLDNINLHFYGKKCNLGTICYNDVLELTKEKVFFAKNVQFQYYDSCDEKVDEFLFTIVNREFQYGRIRFIFESNTKKLKYFYIYFPKDMDYFVKFENTDNSHEAWFPFMEKDLPLIFGEDMRVFRNFRN